MNIKPDILTAMSAYNKTHQNYFSLMDAAALSMVLDNIYTNDADFAQMCMCNDRTAKRSINRLCDAGLIHKEFDHRCNRTLVVNEPKLKEFMHHDI